MVHVDLLELARTVVPFHPSRPATKVVLDTPEARLLVFRLKAGQSVPPHRNDSTVVITTLAGEGIVSGSDQDVAVMPGSVVTFAPRELHGIRAPEHELVVLAMIAPAPGPVKDVPIPDHSDTQARA
jgi:quercetin dioxygenase-like cupin family protein